ncbi:MAG: hypothetical protein K2W96_27270 [Gemmataceae bacterium]|nr:hypothetical protein [Gemmataceae bacterium]
MNDEEWFLAEVEAVLGMPAPHRPLRELAEKQLGQAARGAVLDLFQLAVHRFPQAEDTILDIMDALAGWCHPAWRIP